jgi:hypothetical protein
MMIGKIQYAYTNLFTDKSIHTASLKTLMIACRLIFELENKEM